MTENQFTQQICNMLNDYFDANGISRLRADTFVKLPYSQEVVSFDADSWKPEYAKASGFQTDLCIFEVKNGKIIPRVVIEAKLGRVSTHDAITYSYKANMHKNVTSFLRYGIMIGQLDHLPWRLVKHGTNFDFMFTFKDESPTQQEFKEFLKITLEEVKYSIAIEDMLHNRTKNGNTYHKLHKKLDLG